MLTCDREALPCCQDGSAAQHCGLLGLSCSCLKTCEACHQRAPLLAAHVLAISAQAHGLQCIWLPVQRCQTKVMWHCQKRSSMYNTKPSTTDSRTCRATGSNQGLELGHTQRYTRSDKRSAPFTSESDTLPE